MSEPIVVPTIADLTTATLAGDGAFDVLMKANKAHLEDEFSKNRIKGSEYATVYLGSMQATLETALKFLLERQKVGLEAQVLEQQVLLATAQVAKANAEVLQIQKQTELMEQQRLNAITEGEVLVAQKCKLQAEYDVLMLTKDKTTKESDLLAQKVLTEKAQTQAIGVDDNSVIGKQKTLYQAQTDGFKRDAEQKAGKLLIDSWNVRRTTDEATVADGTNKLSDLYVGKAVQKLLDGIGAA